MTKSGTESTTQGDFTTVFRRTLLLKSSFGLFTVSIFLVLACILPLTQRLKREQERHLFPWLNRAAPQWKFFWKRPSKPPNRSPAAPRSGRCLKSTTAKKSALRNWLITPGPNWMTPSVFPGMGSESAVLTPATISPFPQAFPSPRNTGSFLPAGKGSSSRGRRGSTASSISLSAFPF